MKRLTYEECLKQIETYGDLDQDPAIMEIMKEASPQLQEKFVDIYMQLNEKIKDDIVELYHNDREKFDQINKLFAR